MRHACSVAEYLLRSGRRLDDGETTAADGAEAGFAVAHADKGRFIPFPVAPLAFRPRPRILCFVSFGTLNVSGKMADIQLIPAFPQAIWNKFGREILLGTTGRAKRPFIEAWRVREIRALTVSIPVDTRRHGV